MYWFEGFLSSMRGQRNTVEPTGRAIIHTTRAHQAKRRRCQCNYVYHGVLQCMDSSISKHGSTGRVDGQLQLKRCPQRNELQQLELLNETASLMAERATHESPASLLALNLVWIEEYRPFPPIAATSLVAATAERPRERSHSRYFPSK